MPVVSPLSPMARVAAHADWLSGLFRPDDPADPAFGGFPNADLTIHLARPPEGEWIGIRGTPIGTATALASPAVCCAM